MMPNHSIRSLIRPSSTAGITKQLFLASSNFSQTNSSHRPFHTCKIFHQSNDTTKSPSSSSSSPASSNLTNTRLSKFRAILSSMQPELIPNTATKRAKRTKFIRQSIDPKAAISNPLPRSRLARSEHSPDKFDFNVGLIVERIPRYLNPPADWEVKYENIKQKQKAAKIPPVPEPLRVDTVNNEPSSASSSQSSQSVVEFKTSDDHSNNRQSLDRSLNESLYLLVKQSSGDWTFPQSPYDLTNYRSLSLDKAARQLIPSILGENLNVYTLGFAPVAVHSQEPNSDNERGNKLFLYHGILLDGSVELRGEHSEFVWATKSQLSEYLQSKQLLKIARDVLITDSDSIEDDKQAELTAEEWNLQQGKPKLSKTKTINKPKVHAQV